MEHVLVTGAQGMLGSALVEELASHCTVTCVDIGEFDITDAELSSHAIRSASPAVVINCAAYTNVDGAEGDAARAHAVNAVGAGNVARAAAAAGAKIVQISTDYVFDGSKTGPYEINDEPAPLNVYGASKLAGERAVIESGAPWLIVRTSWLYGHQGPNFVETIIRAATERGALEVVDDQLGAPTNARDLSSVLRELVDGHVEGIVHATNSGSTTWFGFARAILGAAGMADVTIDPVGSEAFPRPAARPRNSVLSLARLRELTGWEPRPWLAAVQEYIAER